MESASPSSQLVLPVLSLWHWKQFQSGTVRDALKVHALGEESITIHRSRDVPDCWNVCNAKQGSILMSKSHEVCVA